MNHNNNVFQQRTIGNVLFRQQSVKLNDENKISYSKGTISTNDDNLTTREFGKDITHNLTNQNFQNQENLNPNSNKGKLTDLKNVNIYFIYFILLDDFSR